MPSIPAMPSIPPALLVARSVIRPCFMPRATIQTLTGYAIAKPTITPSDITIQNNGSPGHIARMSRPIIRNIITGAMPAIMQFIEISSGRKLRRTFSMYVPPIVLRMNNAWKIRRPNRKPPMYSTIRSAHIGRPTSVATTAASMIPVASPATQWTVEPTLCFHSGLMNSSWPPGVGSLSAMT